MEGASLATSYDSRTTTSYLSREIRWGRKFAECTIWDKLRRKYIVNHKLFNKTEEVIIPLCSAQRLSEVYKDILWQTFTSYSGSILSDASKNSSPSTMSPLIDSSQKFNKISVAQNNENDSYGDENSDSVRAVVAADIHYRPKNISDEIEKSECVSSDSSANEEYTAFMDLSVEDLTEERVKTGENVERRPRTLSDTAKEFLLSVQKYVADGNISKNRSSKTYEETSF